MKFSTPLVAATLAATASARAVIPATSIAARSQSLAIRQEANYTTINEFLEGGCRPYIIIYARGSTEEGNVGDSPGPQTIDGLKAALGTDNVAGQGFDYPATLPDNLLPGGCRASHAEDMAALITQAATECPTSFIAVSGYSQGAALTHASIEQLDDAARARVYAAVTYGDTQATQDNWQIPNYDPERTLILCHDNDKVCDGTLLITDGHFGYEDLAPEAVEFMVSKMV